MTKVEAEMSAFAVKPAAMVPPTVFSCATAVKAVPVIGVVAKPGTNKPVGVKSEPAVVKAVQQVKPVGVKLEPADVKAVQQVKPGVKPVVPSAVVESKLGSEAAGFTSIFLRVSKAVTDDQLQVIIGVNAKIAGRRRKNRNQVCKSSCA